MPKDRLLYCSVWFFGIAASLVGSFGIAVLITYSMQNGVDLALLRLVLHAEMAEGVGKRLENGKRGVQGGGRFSRV